MHRAPAVSFSVGRSRWQLRCVAALSLASTLSAVDFAWSQSTPADWRAAAVLLAALAAPLLALRGWQTSAIGQLRWDGQHWHWSGFDRASHCHLALLADLQRFVLVRLSAADQTSVWLWLEPPPGNAQWLPLRRAIVSCLPCSGEVDSAMVDKGELA